MNTEKIINQMPTIVGMHANLGLKAGAAITFLLINFHKNSNKEDEYRYHMSNTFVYRTLKASLSQSCIDVYEFIDSQISYYKLNLEVPGLSELRLHRLQASHAYEANWKDAAMKDALKGGLILKDSPIQRIYNVNEFFIRLAKRNGLSPMENGADSGTGLVEMIKIANIYSLNPNMQLNPNFEDEVRSFLRSFNEAMKKSYAEQYPELT